VTAKYELSRTESRGINENADGECVKRQITISCALFHTQLNEFIYF